MPNDQPDTSVPSTWALARAVAVELADATAVQTLSTDLFGHAITVYLGALPPAASVTLPYALVEPDEESNDPGETTHAVKVLVSMDASAGGNTAEARPLENGSSVLVVGRGGDLQNFVDAIRRHFDGLPIGSIPTGCDVVFDGFSAYPTQSAAMTFRFRDFTAFP